MSHGYTIKHVISTDFICVIPLHSQTARVSVCVILKYVYHSGSLVKTYTADGTGPAMANAMHGLAYSVDGMSFPMKVMVSFAL